MLAWFMTTGCQGFTAQAWPYWSIVTRASDGGSHRSTLRLIKIKNKIASCDLGYCDKSCLRGLLFEYLSAKATKLWHLPCHPFSMRPMINIVVKLSNGGKKGFGIWSAMVRLMTLRLCLRILNLSGNWPLWSLRVMKSGNDHSEILISVDLRLIAPTLLCGLVLNDQAALLLKSHVWGSLSPERKY